MANVPPSARWWCPVGCGTPPGEKPVAVACACNGCIAGYARLAWDEFMAWRERERHREQTPYIEPGSNAKPLTLTQRLESYKHRKRSANFNGGLT